MPKEFVYMWFTSLLTSNKSSEYVAFCVPSHLTYLTILVWVKVDRIVSRLWTDMEINSTHILHFLELKVTCRTWALDNK